MTIKIKALPAQKLSWRGFLIVRILQLMKTLDNFYEQQDEPNRGCLLALPVKKVEGILQKALDLYQNGVVKIKGA